MQGQIQKDNTSGRVHIQGNKIFWDVQGKNILHIQINDIVIIGEYTNADGPHFDDWFITFVTKDRQWQSIPLYADNREILLDYLCDKFQPDFKEMLLIGSFEWNSLVRHPKHLRGKPLFKLTPTENYKEPKTFFDKILSSTGLGSFDTTKYIDLTDEVKTELTNACR